MDRNAFNQMMAGLRPKLYRFALSFTKRTDEAEDVVQEIGVKLWEKRKTLGGVNNVEAYAMSAVKNRCLDYGKSWYHNKTSELTEAYHDISHEQTPDIRIEQADMVNFVRKMIANLPVQQQMVIRLRDIEGYELDEIAEILNMNSGTLRANLSRARQKIREELLKQVKV